MQTHNTALDSACVFQYTESFAPAATAAASCVEQAFTSTSKPLPLKSTDHVAVTGPGSGNNVGIAGARINSTGQVVIAFINPTAGALTHATGVFTVKITRS